ncbi:MAG: hypothetical protein K2N48_10505 [Muribaculaceae bacterium]|nr:hypothetical protein [Muribaculaceae bacterium]
MDYSLKDTVDTWETYPKYTFIPVFIGEPNSAVFKFSDVDNRTTSKVYDSPFWEIYAVTPKGMTKIAGFIFVGLGEVVRMTTKAVASAKRSVGKDLVSCTTKEKAWSSNGLDLIRYENIGEVITDLCTVMGVDVTINLEENR